jgi:hypothetical protein
VLDLVVDGQNANVFLASARPKWQAEHVDITSELVIREAMFDELDRRVAASGDGNLSWELTERFSFFGEAIAMRQARGKGINKPRQLDAALSITTAYRGPNSQRPYEDSIGEDGYPRYKYESTDPNLSTNRAMRAAMHARLPLAYFLGVRKAVYRPVYPVYVIGEDWCSPFLVPRTVNTRGLTAIRWLERPACLPCQLTKFWAETFISRGGCHTEEWPSDCLQPIGDIAGSHERT